MKLYVLSSVDKEEEGRTQTVWGLFKSIEDAKEHIEIEELRITETNISIDVFEM